MSYVAPLAILSLALSTGRAGRGQISGRVFDDAKIWR
jgi:hypothetical protein